MNKCSYIYFSYCQSLWIHDFDYLFIWHAYVTVGKKTPSSKDEMLETFNKTQRLLSRIWGGSYFFIKNSLWFLTQPLHPFTRVSPFSFFLFLWLLVLFWCIFKDIICWWFLLISCVFCRRDSFTSWVIDWQPSVAVFWISWLWDSDHQSHVVWTAVCQVWRSCGPEQKVEDSSCQ